MKKDRLNFWTDMVSRSEILIFCIAFAAYKFSQLTIFGDPDVPWHIMSGEYIRLNGQIPTNDHWAFTSVGQVWYNISWLWDVFISYIYTCFGLQTLANMVATLFAVILVLIYRELRKTYNVGKDDIAIAVTAVSGLLLYDSLYARPQLAAYFCMLACMRIMERNHYKPRLGTFFKIALLTAVWVNIHGTFLLIWFIGGAYFVEAVVHKQWQAVKQLCGLGFTALFASMMNPIGPEIYLGVWRTLHTAIQPYISEWRPFTFGSIYGYSVALILFISTGVIQVECALRHKLMALIILIGSLTSIRNWQVLAILGVPSMAASFDMIYNLYDHSVKKAKDLLFKYVRLALIFTAVVTMGFSINYSKIVDKENTPIKEIQFLIDNYPDSKVYNEYDHGGPIIFYARGRLKHFIDGRAGTAFPEEMIIKYVNFIRGDEYWDSLFEAYPVDVAIVPKKSFNNIRTRNYFDDWNMVYEGDVAKVYARNELEAQPVLIE
jgi:hypothetical protein